MRAKQNERPKIRSGNSLTLSHAGIWTFRQAQGSLHSNVGSQDKGIFQDKFLPLHKRSSSGRSLKDSHDDPLVCSSCSQEHLSAPGATTSAACCHTAGRATEGWDYPSLLPRQRNRWALPRKLGLQCGWICIPLMDLTRAQGSPRPAASSGLRGNQDVCSLIFP